jgi:hypothetical protein
MIKCSFNQVVYKKPRFSRTDRCIDSVIGFDTETYTDGKPFLFCLSDGSVMLPKDIPRKLFTRKYRNTHFGVWNIKFDAGSIIHNLPVKQRTKLREDTKVNYRSYKYTYIPHKMLRIGKGKNAVTFWDINSFYKSSLEKAAKTYLQDKKKPLRTKSFTPSYVKQHRQLIIEYCLHDAVLVARLYDYFYNGLVKLDVYPKALYSAASISFHYFTLRTDIVTVWRQWKYYQDLLLYACESYAGGKFEVYKRGRFEGVSYDIISAYPYEIKQLKDLRDCICYQSDGYEKDADYGFLRVHIENHYGRYLPCGQKYGANIIYPAGTFNATITLPEYKYLKKIGVKVKIISAWYIILKSNYCPYAKTVDELFQYKESFRGKDKRMYAIVKIMLNGFYGKMVQLILKSDNKYHAGPGFNPIYAAMITGNTRIRLSEVCNRNPRQVYAVHTDSIIMGDTLPGKMLGSNLGQWSKEDEGDGCIIACGIYSIGNKNKFRGVELSDKLTWLDLLKKNRKRFNITIPQKAVMSWVEANFRSKDELTNQFLDRLKTIDLNCDKKRAWPGNVSANDLYNGSQQSYPIILTDPEPGTV